MIIQLDSATAENIAEAKSSLQALARSWGHEISQPPPTTTPVAGTTHGDDAKAIDPISLTALVLSIPSTALAVSDLADRIRKRHRAREVMGKPSRKRMETRISNEQVPDRARGHRHRRHHAAGARGRTRKRLGNLTACTVDQLAGTVRNRLQRIQRLTDPIL
jgi:hypothetical protein